MIPRDIVKGQSGSSIYKKYEKMKEVDKFKELLPLEIIQKNSTKIIESQPMQDLKLKPRQEHSNVKKLNEIKSLNENFSQQ